MNYKIKEVTKMTAKRIVYFDMDGTIADLYNSDRWLEKIQARQPVFSNLAPMVDMVALQKVMGLLRDDDTDFGVITWLPMDADEQYCKACTVEKSDWLMEMFGTDAFTECYCVKYDTPKHEVPGRKLTKNDILIDDNWDVLLEWNKAGGRGVHASQILNYLVKLL